MGDEVGWCEVGLEAALAELREVVALPEAEDVLNDRSQDRLGQSLLVCPTPR